MISRQIKFKNVTLRTTRKNGIESYKLLGDAGEIAPFTMFISALEKRSRPNTVRAYARAIAFFFDYFYEAGYHIAAKEGRTDIRRMELKQVIESWSDYLTYGTASGNSLVLAVCQTLPSPLVGSKTNVQYHAALKNFLLLSERFRSEGEVLSRNGLVLKKYDAAMLYEDMGKTLAISGRQRAEMIRTSMLSGVMAGGPRKRQVNILPLDDINGDDFDGRNLFPLDLFQDFVDALRTFRDKALYCFYAASGCRSYEGLQLLWEDVDLVNQEVRLVNPSTRSNHPSYLYLTPQQRRKLCWKGRATEETFLIEPFASMFWKYLREYVAKECVPHGQHQFVFQVLRLPRRGAPYFTTAPDSRRGVFKTAHLKVGLPSTVRGPHSLRHAYGTYTLNYLPRSNGEFGLPLPIVRVLLGHKSIKSTEVYARQDKDLIRAQLHFANTAVFNGNVVALNQNELKVTAILAMARNLGWKDGVKQMEGA